MRGEQSELRMGVLEANRCHVHGTNHSTNLNGNVRSALEDARTATLGARVHALHDRAFVHIDARDLQFVHVGADVVLGVGDGRQQHLANQVRRLLVGVFEHRAGRAHGHAADQVRHQTRLLRRDARTAQDGLGLSRCHDGIHYLAAGAAAFLSLPPWPLNVRVTANSPSLCPTMFSLTSTGTCRRPLWTATVRPTISGRIIERRDQVLIGRLLLLWFAASTFLRRCRSMNGPFLSERGISMSPYLVRRRTISFCVRLLLRVLKPLVGVPHGLTGWRPPEVRPSPPPCGWSTGFITTPRTVGRMPSQRLAPALPSLRRLCSEWPNSPTVARHSTGTLRISPERRRSVAYPDSRATNWAEAPALRASCAPLPGLISMQCTVVPIGMLRSGSVLPSLIGASVPAINCVPTWMPFGAMM